MSAVMKTQAAAEWKERTETEVNKISEGNLSGKVTMTSQGRLLKIPAQQIPPNVIYPPGCHVVCMDYEVGVPPVVLYGIIQYVAVNLDSMNYVYAVQSKPYGEVFYSAESSLQFAQAMPVWAKLPGHPSYTEALVFSAQQLSATEKPVYCVTKASNQGYFSGIAAKYVKYRGPGSERPVEVVSEEAIAPASTAAESIAPTSTPEVTSAEVTQKKAEDDEFNVFACFQCLPAIP